MSACPSCGTADPEVFHTQAGVPTNSCLLLETREAARSYPTGRLDLAACGACGFVANLAFDPALTTYSSAYEETQGFSPRFRAFAHDLAERWVERYDLRGRTVLEIGCGKGEFLAEMCELGVGHGIGVDPSYRPERLESRAADRMTFYRETYEAHHGALAADAVVCRHTLEHIGDVRAFMGTVRRALGDRHDVPVLFELPDAWRVLAEHAFWDVYYEHCSYFTAGSLARLFRQEGFRVLDLELVFDDQYLLIEALPDDVPAPGAPLALEEDPAAVVAEARAYATRHAADIAERRATHRAWDADGRTAVVWGAGSKGVAYLTTLGDDAGLVAAAVDINPHKQGMFMAGTGHRIVAPEELVQLRPDLAVVMNPIYAQEIQQSLGALGLPRTRTVPLGGR